MTTTATERSVRDDFAIEYYNSFVWERTKYLGVPIAKCPFDLWTYQELIHRVRPSVIIETGTWFGGSALFFHDIMRLSDVINPQVVTIDVTRRERRVTPGIVHITGSSTDVGVYVAVREYVYGTVMVVLDSNHARDHVLRELELYAPLVSFGSYLIVEDTNVNGRPVLTAHGPGPGEALDMWLPAHPEFSVDTECEKFLMTMNPGGWLRRVRREETQ